MKRLIALSVVLALSVVATGGVRAQSGGMKGMDMKDMPMKDMDMKGMESGKKPQAKVHKGAGTVTKVDPAAGTVTFAHGPIKTMNWPAMTMTFKVKDKAMLKKVSPEKKVQFEFVEQGSDYVITDIK